MFKILVLEDNAQLNKTICDYLDRSGYETVRCLDSSSAFNIIYGNDFDLIISDIMMPGIDGFDFAKSIRNYNENIPILFISALEDISSKKKAYGIGVDDYLTKPFSLEELRLKVGALLRRADIRASNTLTVGGTVFKKDEKSVTVNGEEIRLTAREFDIIFKMLSYPKKIFTRSQLVNEMWDDKFSTNPRVVDVYITKLREKFVNCEDFTIETAHGLGYKAVIK